MRRKIVIAVMLAMLATGLLAVGFSVWKSKVGSGIIVVPDDYSTIQEAVDAANPGDTIYVKPGTYIENVYIYKDNLTLTGEDRETTIIDGSTTGIPVHISADNIIFERFTLQNSRIGISVTDSSNCWVYGNKVKGCEWIGIEVRECSKICVYDNELIDTDSFESVVLNHCVDCNVSGNELYDEYDGVYLKYSSNCYVTDNNITSCFDDGIWMAYSSGIEVFHNSFIDNGRQAFLVDSGANWNDSYPSGGNYWCDYNGEDKYSGPNQDQFGSDGIGDTPYDTGVGIDGYPLMGSSRETLVQYEQVTLHGEEYEVKVVCNSSVLDFEVTPGSEQITVSGTSGTTGYGGIVQPVDLNLTNIEVFLNNTKITPEITTNGTHYYIYFAFNFTSQWWVSIAFGVLGDVNFDGTVDIYDAVTLSAAAGTAQWDPDWNAKCDLNDDLEIDLYDAVILSAHSGETWPT